MPDQSAQNAEKPSDDVGRDRAMKDEGGRRWVYFVVKVLVLVVVLTCLIRANVVRERGERPISFGWPLGFTHGLTKDGPFEEIEPDAIWDRPLCWFSWPLFFFNTAIAIILLCYLWHVLTIIHRRWKPKYQVSLRFVVLVLPVLLACVMILIHYDFVTWRRPFLVPVYLAVLASAVCFVYEVWAFVRKRKADA